MAEQKELAITPRTVMGKANKRLRREGQIPGNISGHNQEPQAVQFSADAFERLLRKGGTRSILRLVMDGSPAQTVLVRHIQRGPASGKPVHIDFTRVNMNESITARLSLHFVGEAPAVKNEGGSLLQVLETIEVECMASAIVDAIEVDISSLTELDSTLSAGDIKLPENYKLITPGDELIAKITAPRGEEPATAAATEAATPAASATETPAAENREA